MKTWIQGSTIVNTKGNPSGQLDLLIEDGKIMKIGTSSEISLLLQDSQNHTVIAGKGLHLLPGLVDIHVHFREPGFEHKETFASGSKAAAAGGFTTVAVMPNTKPSPDTLEHLDFIQNRINEKACIEVKVVGAITRDIQGEELADITAMKTKGIVGITDDGKAVMNNSLLKEAYVLAEKHQLPVICHCEDHSKTTNLPYKDFKNEHENTIIERDINLGVETGAHVHITHLTTREGIELIKQHKKMGHKVTCDVTAHHLALDKSLVDNEDPITKVNPPLRNPEDREMLIRGIMDGTVDAIASDHAPHDAASKELPINQAAFGISGIETSFAVCHTELCVKRDLPIERLVELMSAAPADLIGIEAGTLAVGADANMTLVDLAEEWIVDSQKFLSMGKNTPLNGYKAVGKVIKTFFKGQMVFDSSIV